MGKKGTLFGQGDKQMIGKRANHCALHDIHVQRIAKQSSSSVPQLLTSQTKTSNTALI